MLESGTVLPQEVPPALLKAHWASSVDTGWSGSLVFPSVWPGRTFWTSPSAKAIKMPNMLFSSSPRSTSPSGGTFLCATNDPKQLKLRCPVLVMLLYRAHSVHRHEALMMEEKVLGLPKNTTLQLIYLAHEVTCAILVLLGINSNFPQQPDCACRDPHLCVDWSGCLIGPQGPFPHKTNMFCNNFYYLKTKV